MPALYLIPTPLAAADTPCLLPQEQVQIAHITDFVVEAEKNRPRLPETPGSHARARTAAAHA